MEERLLAEVEGLVIEWASQDCVCSRCGAIKQNDFLEHCTCSGKWVESVKREGVTERLKVYQSVARFYDLRMLGGVVTEVQEGM
jgi:DNA polymerase epsilon subunit 1